MCETPSKMHMHMVKIDNNSFRDRGGGGGLSPSIVNCLKYPGSDRVQSR